MKDRNKANKQDRLPPQQDKGSVAQDDRSNVGKIFLHSDTPGPPRIINEQPAEGEVIITQQDRAENEVFLGSDNFADSLKSILAALAAVDSEELDLTMLHVDAALDSNQAAQFHYRRGLEADGDHEFSESWRNPMQSLDLSEILDSWQERGLLAESEHATDTHSGSMSDVLAVSGRQRISALIAGAKLVEEKLEHLQDASQSSDDELQETLTSVASAVTDALISSRIVVPVDAATEDANR